MRTRKVSQNPRKNWTGGGEGTPRRTRNNCRLARNLTRCALMRSLHAHTKEDVYDDFMKFCTASRERKREVSRARYHQIRARTRRDARSTVARGRGL